MATAPAARIEALPTPPFPTTRLQGRPGKIQGRPILNYPPPLPTTPHHASPIPAAATDASYPTRAGPTSFHSRGPSRRGPDRLLVLGDAGAPVAVDNAADVAARAAVAVGHPARVAARGVVLAPARPDDGAAEGHAAAVEARGVAVEGATEA